MATITIEVVEGSTTVIEADDDADDFEIAVEIVEDGLTTIIEAESAGPQGPTGASGGVAYTHTQSVAATTWTINHNLGYYPAITLRTVGGVRFEASILDASVNQAIVGPLAVATAGTARCV